jgi:hypothetical protein
MISKRFPPKRLLTLDDTARAELFERNRKAIGLMARDETQAPDLTILDQTTLLVSEKAILENAGKIVAQWGYWTGRLGQHEKYEEQTHKSGVAWTQDITDPLFRCLQQLNRGKGIHDTDGLAKFGISRVLLTQDHDWAPATELWTRFLREPGVKDAIERIARFTPSASHGGNPFGVSRDCFVLVYSARVFLKAAAGDRTGAARDAGYAFERLDEYSKRVTGGGARE